MSSCNLSAIDVTKNTALKRLVLDGNKLTSLDVTKNTALEELFVADNSISSLDVTKNTKLNTLIVMENELSSLDLSKNSKLMELDVRSNCFKSFEGVKANPDINAEEAFILSDNCPIDKLPETIKAGEVLDLSRYAKCGTTKSTYFLMCPGSVIPESDKDFKFVFGNAYAGKSILIQLANDNAYVSFFGTVQVIENPDAPAAPGEATGDVPVDDISGTITAAESTKDFDAQEVVFSDEQGKFVLGEKVNKEDLTLGILPVSADEALYDKLAKADKGFKKDEARLLAYDILLSKDSNPLIKLRDGINLTLKYPSDMAKDWNKYNFKVYHFVEFDYDKLEFLDSPKIEEVKCTADKNGIHFKAPSFSVYVISVTPKSGGSDSPSPKTSDATILFNVVLLTLLLSTAGILGVLAKRRGELV